MNRRFCLAIATDPLQKIILKPLTHVFTNLLGIIRGDLLRFCYKMPWLIPKYDEDRVYQ